MNIFRIALPGSDVKNSHLDEEVLNSLYPSPKVSTIANPPHVGIISLNWSTTGLFYAQGTSRVLYSFPHNYNYIPSVLGVYTFNNGSRIINATMPFLFAGLGIISLEATRDYVNLVYFSIDLSNTFPIPPFQLKVRFYVFADPGV